MGLLDSIKKLFADPKPVSRLEDLEPGQAIVDGVVRLGGEGPLLSPIKGQPCVAFFYTAAHQVPGRSGQVAQRPLRATEGFQPFALEVDGGQIEAVPRVPGGFTREAHQALASAGYQGFRAAEELVSPRARVRLRGVARRSGDGWVLTYRRIEILEQPGAKKAGKRRR